MSKITSLFESGHMLIYYTIHPILFDNFVLRLVFFIIVEQLLFEKNKVSKCDALNGIVVCEDNYMHQRSIDRRILLCKERNNSIGSIDSQWPMATFSERVREREKKRTCVNYEILLIHIQIEKSSYHSSPQWILRSIKTIHYLL